MRQVENEAITIAQQMERRRVALEAQIARCDDMEQELDKIAAVGLIVRSMSQQLDAAEARFARMS